MKPKFDKITNEEIYYALAGFGESLHDRHRLQGLHRSEFKKAATFILEQSVDAVGEREDGGGRPEDKDGILP